MATVTVKFQDDSNGRGWVMWMGDREWQPVIGCADPAEVPDKWDVLGSDILDQLPDDIRVVVSD